MSKPILFQFKDPVTQAGDQIQGFCYVRIAEDMPKVQIVLTFQTKEYSKILQKRRIPYDENNPQMIEDKLVEKQQQIQISQDSPQKPSKVSQKQYELNGNQLFRIIRLYGIHDSFMYTQELFSGSVKKGDYKFPFTIPTQFNMASSFYYKSQDGYKQAKCGYKVTLRIDSPDDARTLMMESADVFINSRVQETEQFRSCEGNIVQFLCLNSGTVELSMRIKKNSFLPGSKINVEYTLNNTRSQKAISRILVRLINKLTFIDNDEMERVIEDNKVLEQSWDGVNAGQKKERIQAELELPKVLKATIKTNTIKNQYFLQLEAIADAFLTWLSVPVICQVPIHIQEDQLPVKVSLDGWNFVPILNVSVNAFSNMTVQYSLMPSQQ